MYIVAIARLMDSNTLLVNCFLHYLDLQWNFVSDNIILIFNQSNLNIVIMQKLHPIIIIFFFCIFQIKQNR